MHILIVEDEEVLARSLVEEFRDRGYSIELAVTGAEAIQKMQEHAPDAILLDLLLPQASGFDILKQIRQKESLTDVFIIVLSMLGSEEDTEKAIKLGANAYIVKSRNSLEEIVKKVEALLPNHGQ